MSAPEVSVIVVTYNQESTIGRTLESILAQKCDFDFEIIVGEDASSDQTRRICQDYAVRYPEKIRLMPETANKGIVDNYFDCLANCRGMFVTDCAGDDYWPEPGRLQVQRDYLRENVSDVAVMSDWLIVENGQTVLSSRTDRYRMYASRTDGPTMMTRLLGAINNIPLLSAMMFRKSVTDGILAMDADMVRRREWGCEDLPLMVALASKGAFGYLPIAATAYIVGDATVSNNRSDGALFDFYIKAATCLVDLIGLYAVDPCSVKDNLDSKISYLAALATSAFSSERSRKLRRLASRWPVSMPLKARLRLTLMLKLREACAAAKKE
ncbi:MAG: glycosyltransferase [Paramuribaculum sp.]|nr:glycosyltransferase [Paramuribaculum sp.]